RRALPASMIRLGLVWLASPQSDGISACPPATGTSLPAAEAAARACAPAAWLAPAQAAAAARGHAMQWCEAPLTSARHSAVSAISARACAHQSPKTPIERRQVIEAGIKNDGRDRRVRAAQIHGSAVETRAQHELIRRHAHHGAKGAQE